MGEKVIQGLRIDNLRRSIRNMPTAQNPKATTIIQINLTMSVVLSKWVTFCCCFNILFNITALFEAKSKIVCTIGISKLY
jgi:hypothetical protein